jgi:hypothetical protein
MFRAWGLRFEVTFNDDLLNQHEIIDLLHLGGEQVGLGDWRPKHGRYIVVDDSD